MQRMFLRVSLMMNNMDNRVSADIEYLVSGTYYHLAEERALTVSSILCLLVSSYCKETMCQH